MPSRARKSSFLIVLVALALGGCKTLEMAKLDLEHFRDFVSPPKEEDAEIPPLAALPPPVVVKPASKPAKKPVVVKKSAVPPKPGIKPTPPAAAPVPVAATPPAAESAQKDPLLAMTGAQLLEKAGAPDMRRKDPPAEIWHYQSGACTMDFYFYGVGEGAEKAYVEHYEVSPPQETSMLIRPTEDPQTCLKALASRRPF